MLTDRGVYRKWAAEAKKRADLFAAVERFAWNLIPRTERHRIEGTPRFFREDIHGCGNPIDPNIPVIGLYARAKGLLAYSYTWLMCKECADDFFARMLTDYEFMERCEYPNPVCGDSVMRGETGYALERSRKTWALLALAVP